MGWTTRALDRLTLTDTEKGAQVANALFVHTQLIFCVITAKALYRRALANVALHEDEDAERDLLEALKITPNDQACTRELSAVRAAKKAKRNKEKKAFKGLFA